MASLMDRVGGRETRPDETRPDLLPLGSGNDVESSQVHVHRVPYLQVPQDQQRVTNLSNDFFLMGLVSREGGLDMRDILLHFSSSSFLSLAAAAAATLSGTGMKERK